MAFKKLGVLIAAVLLTSSCATLEKPQVSTIPEGPKVSPVIAKSAQDSMRGLKRKVAIGRFTNETRYGQSFFLNNDFDRVGKQAVDILSSKLLATEKFILLERADLDKINKELSIGNLRPLKNMADYLIVGSITEFGRKEVSDVGIFSRVKKQEAYAKVHVRLIDIYTGQLLYSEEGEGTAFSEAGTVVGVGARAGYDSSLNDKAIEAAINNLASNVIQNLLDKPWRAYILGYEDGFLIVSGGKAQNITPSIVFEVFQEGRKVINPQTNLELTLPGKRVGSIKVMTLAGEGANEICLCEVVEGHLSEHISKKDFTGLYVSQPK